MSIPEAPAASASLAFVLRSSTRRPQRVRDGAVVLKRLRLPAQLLPERVRLAHARPQLLLQLQSVPQRERHLVRRLQDSVETGIGMHVCQSRLQINKQIMLESNAQQAHG